MRKRSDADTVLSCGQFYKDTAVGNNDPDEYEKFQKNCSKDIKAPIVDYGSGWGATIDFFIRLSNIFGLKSKMKNTHFDKELRRGICTDILLKLPLRVINATATIGLGLKKYTSLSGRVMRMITGPLFLRIAGAAAVAFAGIELVIQTYRFGKQVQFGRQFDFSLIQKIDRALVAKPRKKQALCLKIVKRAKKAIKNSTELEILLEKLEENEGDREVNLKKLKAIVIGKNLETVRKKYFSVSTMENATRELTKVRREFAKRVGVAVAKKFNDQNESSSGIDSLARSLKEGSTASLEEGAELIQAMRKEHNKLWKVHFIGVLSALVAVAAALTFFLSIPTCIPLVLMVLSLVFYAAYTCYVYSLAKVDTTNVLDDQISEESVTCA